MREKRHVLQWKSILSFILCLMLCFSAFLGMATLEASSLLADLEDNLVVHYDFQSVSGTSVPDVSGNSKNGTLYNNASIVDAPGEGNKAMALVSGSNQYLRMPQSIMAGLTNYTISVYMKQTQVQNAAWLVSVANSSTTGYIFIAPSSAGGQYRFAITAGTYSAESGINATALGADKWYHVVAKQEGSAMTLYVDGQQVGAATTSLRANNILGSSNANYLGRSAYSADPYWKGQISDFRIYNTALSNDDINELYSELLYIDPLAITSVSCEGEKTKQIEYAHDARSINIPVFPYVDRANMTVNIDYNEELATISPDPATVTDYSAPVTFTLKDRETDNALDYTINVVTYGNSIFKDPHADPQIMEYNGKYYIYSTTDGASGWGGYYFKCYSSVDLVNWEDEGIILDLAASTPYLNSKGVEVGIVPWATGNAWAPAIIEKDGIFYYYFSGHNPSNNVKNIGVATSTSPTGPFVAQSTPLFTGSDAYAGQAIDPCVFEDPISGDYFIYFGQSTYCTAFKLNDNMISVDATTKTRINLGSTFREGIYVIYKEAGNANGNYYFMWSENDTGSEDYRVRYGVSKNPLGSSPNTTSSSVTGNTLILQKDTSKKILATGHHSVLNIPGTDRWIICYHRFQRFGGNGYTREVCLDEMKFAPNGTIQTVKPTLEGILKPLRVGDTTLDLRDATDALELFGIDDVRHNITLPETGEYGTTITWESSHPAIITDEAVDGKAPGVVTRPIGGAAVVVTLTATLTDKLGQTMTKSFEATVTPTDPSLDTDYDAGYLWTYFNGTSLQPSGSTGTTNNRYKIFYGFSEDGLHWNTINRKSGTQYPIAESVVGYTGVRDPHVIRSHEGDKYWILGTDLQDGYDQANGSKSVIVWESYDLINWTESRLEMVFSYAGNVWAPEAIYDEESGDYLVYWASRDQRDGATSSNTSALRMYVSRTRDFHTFTDPVLWADEHDNTSSEKNIIDSSLAYVNGGYYRFSTSDWYTVVDYCDTLSTDINDWTRIMYRGTHSSYGLDSMEGLTSYQLPDGRWCLMGDNSAYRGFVIEEEDFHTQKWTKLATSGTNSKSNTFDATFRHGTVMRLSKTEEQRLMAAYGQEYTYKSSADSEARHSVYVRNGSANPFVTTAGTSVTVTRDSSISSTFQYWVAEGISLTDTQKTSSAVTFTMPANDVSLVAMVAPTALEVSAKTLALLTGEEAALTAKATAPKDGISDVIWSSSDESVATVDENGKVTALTAGTAAITATSKANGAVTDTCTVTVTLNMSSDSRINIVSESVPEEGSDVFNPSFNITALQTITLRLFVAEYDANGALIKTAMQTLTVDEGDTQTIQASLPRSANGVTYKFFLWDGSLKPLSNFTTTEGL